MSILRRYINMIGAANNLNPDDVEKPINVLQFNRRVFKNSQVRIYSGLKWPDMTKPAAERIENPDGSIAKIKFNGHYHTTFNGAPAFAGLAIPVRFSVKPGEKIVWRVRGKTNKKHIGLPVDVWFKQRPPIVSYQVTNLLGSYGSFSVDSNGDGLADGWMIEGYPDLKVVSNSIQYLKKTTTKQWTFIASQFIPTNNTDKWFFKIKSKTYSTNPAQSPLVHLYEFIGCDINNNYIWQSGGFTQIYGNPNSDFNVYYTSYTFTNPNVVKLRILSFHIDHPSYTTGVINEAWIDYAMVVNLTSMGELPQTLKQFFAPSNITRWDQLATSSNITATNGRVMPGNDWLNLLIPYGENTYTVQLEYDTTAETWTARTTTTRQGSAIYNVNNLLGNTGSFSSSSGGLGTGWQLYGNYTPSISSGRQVLTLNNFTNSTGSTITHRIKQNLTNMINEHYYYFYFQASVSDPNIQTYCWIDLYDGSEPQWGVAAKLVQATALTDYADVFQALNNNVTASVSLGIISQPTGTTYTQTFTVDNVMLVDLTAMGELPPKIQEKFPTLKYWYQFATQSTITAADGSAMSGVSWLQKFLPFSDRNYTVSLFTNTPQDAAVYVQSKPSATGKYTVTNLLGSYGSFSVDSNGDGVADGWAKSYQFGSATLSNKRQTIYPSQNITMNQGLYLPININSLPSYIFAKASIEYFNSSSYNWGIRLLHFGLPSGEITGITTQIRTTVSEVFYRTVLASNSSSLSFFPAIFLVITHPNSYATYTNAILVNLSTMGELPQPLKQFFAPSNITRWDQLATSSNITAINGQIKTGDDWLNLLIPYGEGTYTVEYAILPDGQLATWVLGDEQESTYNAIATIDSASVLNNLQYYEVTNLLGSYGSFSVDSNNDGVADGWYVGIQVNQINNGVQFFSDTITSPETRYMFTRVNIVQSRKYFVRRRIRATRTSDKDSGLGSMRFYNSLMGSQYLFYQGQRQQFTNEYTSVTANYDYDSLYIYAVQAWASPTPGTYTVEIDDVLITDLTTMGELPQTLKQFFAPSNITRWDQLATSSNITAIGNQTKTGNDWLNILIPYGEEIYKVWYAIGPNNELIVSTKPSELVNMPALAAIKKELMDEAIGIYEPTTEGYIDEIIISPNTDNGEAKDFELEIESVDVFKIPANTTPLTRARYTITNLLGSYGSFSVDSNGDGVADGWTFVYSNQTITSGKQRIVITK